MEGAMDKAILASRYVLAVFLLGLPVGLALYAARFVGKLWALWSELFTATDSEVMLGVLYLLDAALVASLVVTVAVSSHESLVRRLGREAQRSGAAWLVDSVGQGALKTKLATAIIAISSIYLLQVFMKTENYADRDIIWSIVIQGLFLIGAVVLAVVDWIEARTKALREKAGDTTKEGEPA